MASYSSHSLWHFNKNVNSLSLIAFSCFPSLVFSYRSTAVSSSAKAEIFDRTPVFNSNINNSGTNYYFSFFTSLQFVNAKYYNILRDLISDPLWANTWESVDLTLSFLLISKLVLTTLNCALLYLVSACQVRQFFSCL